MKDLVGRRAAHDTREKKYIKDTKRKRLENRLRVITHGALEV